MLQETLRRDPLWLQMRRQGFGADEVLRHFGINAPPVDSFGIATKMGIRFSDRGPKDSDVDGAVGYRRVNGFPEAVFYVAKGQSAYRQRFTVAHELGHLLCGDAGKMYRDKFSRQGFDPQEVRANKFAAELLMPAAMVRAYLRVTSPSQLHGIFHVSADAMAIRLKMLGVPNG